MVKNINCTKGEEVKLIAKKVSLHNHLNYNFQSDDLHRVSLYSK